VRLALAFATVRVGSDDGLRKVLLGVASRLAVTEEEWVCPFRTVLRLGESSFASELDETVASGSSGVAVHSGQNLTLICTFVY
jgi:hypothetical protein